MCSGVDFPSEQNVPTKSANTFYEFGGMNMHGPNEIRLPPTPSSCWVKRKRKNTFLRWGQPCSGKPRQLHRPRKAIWKRCPLTRVMASRPCKTRIAWCLRPTRPLDGHCRTIRNLCPTPQYCSRPRTILPDTVCREVLWPRHIRTLVCRRLKHAHLPAKCKLPPSLTWKGNDEPKHF